MANFNQTWLKASLGKGNSSLFNYSIQLIHSIIKKGDGGFFPLQINIMI